MNIKKIFVRLSFVWLIKFAIKLFEIVSNAIRYVAPSPTLKLTVSLISYFWWDYIFNWRGHTYQLPHATNQTSTEVISSFIYSVVIVTCKQKKAFSVMTRSVATLLDNFVFLFLSQIEQGFAYKSII
jgi:hypothetical protein